MARYSVGFQGNPRVRKAGTSVSYTPDQQREFIKCHMDPLYFVEHYVYIKNVDFEELVLFKTRFYQKEMLDKMMSCRDVIVKLPRQCGKTTCVSAVLLWHILFNKNYGILVAAHKGDKARDVLAVIKDMYENLPEWLQHGVKEWNKGRIEIETGCFIRASATSGGSARGDVYNCIYLDEFAFVASHVAEEFVKSVMPTISSGKTTKTFITSTPRGLNLFHKMWTDAVENRTNFAWVEIKWDDVPGRDQAFKQGIIARYGEDYFNQEYGAEFVGSSRTLITGSKLMAMRHTEPIKSTDHLKLYQYPEKGRMYCITADVAEGLGGDCSAAVVFDITQAPYQIAAVYRNRNIDTMAYPGVLFDLGRAYHNAMVLVESNFGGDVARTLQNDYEYENVVATARHKGSTKGGQGISHAAKTKLGLDMNILTKRVGCTNLKSLVEQDQLFVCDADAIQELRRFVVKNKSYAAEDGNDDVAMCLVMFGWMVDQGYIKDLTDVNVRQKVMDLNKDKIEESMTPFGFIYDGGASESNNPVATKGEDWRWLMDDDEKNRDPEPDWGDWEKEAAFERLYGKLN